LLALLAAAAVAAALSNVVSNLPAVLVMLPLDASSGPAAVLAVLAGVNVGPNLSHVGSLAKPVVVQRCSLRNAGRFVVSTRIGPCTVPLTLLAAVLGLWLGIRLFGV
jgi:arsenical pump membrane protein